MPPVSQSSIGNTSQGSILLVEEYDALAAAITSALRKYAPGHTVHVARSLTEATALAKTAQPELLVIDFDPPFPGVSPFLQKMQKTHPEACALIIAGKLPQKIMAATRSAGAVHFVEKPFDVQDFGAAVQALLGPWRDSETATGHGILEDLALADLVIAQCGGIRTVALEVTNGHGKSGEIHLRQGTPTHAEAGRKSGGDALREMLTWDEVEVRERERPGANRQTIKSDWADVLIEPFRRAKPRKPKPKKRVAAKQVTPATPPKPAHKLVVVDDTEMLLVFVEDVLVTSGTEFQITTAPNGIKGIKEIERIKPELVLLDYSLPDINGDEVCRRLLQKDATSRIPVLMMSGHVHEMAKTAASLDNVVATIEKPFRSEALVSLVQQVLTEKRSVRKKVPAARKTTPAAAPPPPPPREPAKVAKKELPPVPSLPEPPPPVPFEPEAPPIAVPTQPAATTESYPAEQADQQSLPFAITEWEQPAPPVRAKPPVQSAPETTAGKPEPSQSVVDKALRAIEQLRRQIAPKEARTEKEHPSPPRLRPAVRPTRPESAPQPIASESDVTVPEDGAPPIQPPPAQVPLTVPSPGHIVAPIEPTWPPQPPEEVLSTRVVSDGPNEVVLSLFLDVVSVQLTPELRMGSIRAKPSSGEVSLHVVGPAIRGKIPENGFKLGEVGLDAKGRITTMRLIPTQVPFRASPTQSSLQIGGVSVVPIDSTSRMQLTPAPQAPMTLLLLAHLELAGVELSSTFEISQIVLKDRGQPIRVTMKSQKFEPESNGTPFETLDVLLDHSSRIKELLLNPVT